jgi:hypothetical protein
MADQYVVDASVLCQLFITQRQWEVAVELGLEVIAIAEFLPQ